MNEARVHATNAKGHCVGRRIGIAGILWLLLVFSATVIEIGWSNSRLSLDIDDDDVQGRSSWTNRTTMLHAGAVIADLCVTGSVLATAAATGEVLVWDLSDDLGHVVGGLVHEGITSIAWSPCGHYLATAGGPTVHVWQLSNMKHPHATYRGGTSILSIDWNPDGERIAISARGGKIAVWSVQGDGRFAEAVATEGRRDVAYMRWNPCGDSIFAICASGAATIYRRTHDNGEYTAVQLKVAGSPVMHADWSPRGRVAVSMQDGRLIVFEGGAYNRIVSVQLHDRLNRMSAWSPDGSRILSISSSGDAILLQIEDGSAVDVADVLGQVTGIQWISSEQVLAADTSGAIRVWRFQEEVSSWLLDSGEHARILVAGWLAGGERVVSVHINGSIRIWER